MVINYDCNIVANSVPAKKMSMDDFKNLLDYFLLHGCAYDPVDEEDMETDDPDLYSYIFTNLSDYGLECPYNVNIENASAVHYDPKHIQGDTLLGFHMLPNGVPVFGIFAGSDYSMPAVFILYPNQEQKISLYVPIHGNGINVDMKCQIGEDPGINEDKQKLVWDQWIANGLASEIDIWEMDETYFKKYGLDWDSAILDCDAMRDEIMKVFKVD